MPRTSIAGTARALLTGGALAFVAACATSPRATRIPSTSSSAAQAQQRIDDADFRALGQEPGWYMDIAEGEKILLVTDYGEHRFEFPYEKPASSDGRDRYDITASGHHLVAVIRQRPCNDSMSGRAFVATVTVTVDGKEYTGCGGPPD